VGKAYRKSNGLASVTDVDLEELERLACQEHPLDLVARYGAQMLLEAAMEAEVEAALGRSRYERRSEDQRGYRNGARTRKLTSGIGELEVNVPRVCGTDEPFRSGVLPAYTRILPKLRGILPALYVEGLSTRDFKRALGPSLGKAGLPGIDGFVEELPAEVGQSRASDAQTGGFRRQSRLAAGSWRGLA
jgi:hypothetical protein